MFSIIVFISFKNSLIYFLNNFLSSQIASFALPPKEPLGKSSVNSIVLCFNLIKFLFKFLKFAEFKSLYIFFTKS